MDTEWFAADANGSLCIMNSGMDRGQPTMRISEPFNTVIEACTPSTQADCLDFTANKASPINAAEPNMLIMNISLYKGAGSLIRERAGRRGS